MKSTQFLITLWLFNIAMENGPFIDDLPINSMVMFHGYVK